MSSNSENCRTTKCYQKAIPKSIYTETLQKILHTELSKDIINIIVDYTYIPKCADHLNTPESGPCTCAPYDYALCKECVCQYTSCEKARIYDQCCEIHKCPKCNDIKALNKNYCQNHACQYPGKCNKSKKYTTCCEKHKCSNKDCTEIRIFDCLYCETHTCEYTDYNDNRCENRKVFPTCCEKHVCDVENCHQLANSMGKCEDHM